MHQMLLHHLIHPAKLLYHLKVQLQVQLRAQNAEVASRRAGELVYTSLDNEQLKTKCALYSVPFNIFLKLSIDKEAMACTSIREGYSGYKC
jgi:hypothetical protein